MLTCLASALLLAAATPRADTLALPDSGFAVRRLADGVYAVIRREPPAVINESNSLFIVGDADVVVVDAQSSTARTREVIAALRAITTKPVRALVHTHWHDDHVAGNGAWRAAYPGVEIIAHETAAADLPTEGARLRLGAMRARSGTIGFLRDMVDRGTSYLGGPISAEERASHLAAARLMADYSDADSLLAPLLPTRTVRDRLVLTQGRRTIELLHAGRGHTRGDLVVHLPRERIVATGDLVMAPVTFVGSTSFPLDFGATVDRVRALRARWLVPGHGPVLDGDVHAARTARLLHDIAAGATASAARGESLAQARRSIALGAHEAALAGASPVGRILFSYYVAGAGVQRAHEQATEQRRAATSRGALARGTLAITRTTVVTMDGDRVLRDATVLVRDGRIVAAGPRVAVPKGARILDGRGRWVIPGLADMHAHLYADEWVPDSVAPYELGVMLANGVTTARLMIGTPVHQRLRAGVEAGRVTGPQLWIASPHLSGDSSAHVRVVRTPEAARAAVREVADAGYDFVKVTTNVPPDVYDAIVAEARARRIRVVGHVDPRVGVARALAAGQQIEHFDAYMESALADSAAGRPSVSDVGAYRLANWESLDHVDPRRVEALAGATARAGVVVTPTLSFFRSWFGERQADEAIRARPDYAHIPENMRALYERSRERYWRNPPSDARRARYVAVRNRLVKAVIDSGGRVMAGSDAPGGLMGYGWAMHRELAALVDAGLTPMQALAAGTRWPAEWIGASADWGMVAPGRRADLVLLDADPLADIRNTARIVAVVAGGRVHERAALDAMIEAARVRLRP